MPVAYASLGRRPVEDEKPLLNELGKLFHVVRAQHKEDRQVRKRQKEQTNPTNSNANHESEKSKDAENKQAHKTNSGKAKQHKQQQQSENEASKSNNITSAKKKSTIQEQKSKRASQRKSVNGGSIWITLKGGFANCNVPLNTSSLVESLQFTENKGYNDNNLANKKGNSNSNMSALLNSKNTDALMKSKKQMRKRIARRVFLTLHKREAALEAAETYIASAWNEADAANLLISTNTNNNNNNVNMSKNNNKTTIVDERIPANSEGVDYLREQYNVASHMLPSDNRPVGQYLFDLVNKFNNAAVHKNENKIVEEESEFAQIYKQVACKWLHRCKKSQTASGNNNKNNKDKAVISAKFSLHKNHNTVKGKNNNHVCLEDVLYSMDIREEMIRSFLYNNDGRHQAENNVVNEIHKTNTNNVDDKVLLNYYTKQLKQFMLTIAEHVEEKSFTVQSYLHETNKNNNKNNKSNVIEDDDDDDEEDEFREAKEYSDEDDNDNNEEEEENTQNAKVSEQDNAPSVSEEKMIDIVPTKCIIKIRNSQRHKHTSILHSQKAINYFVSNFMQTLKRELGAASCKLPRGPIETADNTTIGSTVTNVTSASSNINANVVVNTSSSKRSRKRE